MIKKLTSLTMIAATLAGPVQAHPGHNELPGPQGHVLAHVLFGVGGAALALAMIAVVSRRGWTLFRKGG